MIKIGTASLQAGLLIISCALSAPAQDNRDNSYPTAQQSGITPQTGADETFDLNIPERRITKSNYKASTAVEIGDETVRGVSLRLGVWVSAGRIDALLRNVTGRVRFRATLDPVLNRIRSRQAR